MASYLSSNTLSALELLSTSLHTAIRALKFDPQYAYAWKDRFERLIGMPLAANIAPGSTSWKQKCALVESYGGTVNLLLSSEEMDIALGYTLVHKDIFYTKLFSIITKALIEENEKVLAFLLQVEHAATLEHIEQILYTNNTVVSISFPELGISLLTPDCVKIFVKLELKIYYPLLFRSVIAGHNTPLFIFLLSHPSLDFPSHALEYANTACESSNIEVLDILLSLMEVRRELNADFVQRLIRQADKEYKLDVVDLLQSHPTTMGYVE